MKICVVASNFYPEISKNLISGTLLKLKKNKISNIKIVKVPGTFEIPVVISNLISQYDGFIALGCVIKGETPHFNYICTSTINALGNLSIQSKKPIGNGILTCNNKKQAAKRADPNTKDKGGEAAYAVISVLKIIK